MKINSAISNNYLIDSFFTDASNSLISPQEDMQIEGYSYYKLNDVVFRDKENNSISMELPPISDALSSKNPVKVLEKYTKISQIEKKYYDKKWLDKEVSKLYNVISLDFFEDGEKCDTEDYIQKCIDSLGKEKAMSILMQCYENYYNDVHVLVGLMHSLSHLDYQTIQPNASIMALGLLQHKDIEVREFALKAFENWSDPNNIRYLENLNCDLPWMQRYVDQIIDELRSVHNDIFSAQD